MKKKVLILISILSFSCSSDKTNNPDTTALSLVTGINCRQNFDDPTQKLGNPNSLVSNKFVIYPNPAIESFYISAQENVTDVWLVSATPQKIYQDLNFSTILNTNLYTEQSIISLSNLSLNGQSSTGFSVNIGTLTKGYYKVFVKIGGKIYWDILYKYDSQENTETQFTTIHNFWN
jgi:hypothetical protein